MTRPCYYCEGTGWNDEAIRVDVDDYRGADCDLCEGTGEAMHSANTDTTYRHRDPLLQLFNVRKYGRVGAVDDGWDIYLNVKRRAIGSRVLS